MLIEERKTITSRSQSLFATETVTATLNEGLRRLDQERRGYITHVQGLLRGPAHQAFLQKLRANCEQRPATGLFALIPNNTGWSLVVDGTITTHLVDVRTRAVAARQARLAAGDDPVTAALASVPVLREGLPWLNCMWTALSDTLIMLRAQGDEPAPGGHPAIGSTLQTPAANLLFPEGRRAVLASALKFMSGDFRRVRAAAASVYCGLVAANGGRPSFPASQPSGAVLSNRADPDFDDMLGPAFPEIFPQDEDAWVTVLVRLSPTESWTPIHLPLPLLSVLFEPDAAPPAETLVSKLTHFKALAQSGDHDGSFTEVNGTRVCNRMLGRPAFRTLATALEQQLITQ